MKLVLLGYGRMGQAVEQEAQQRGHEIVARIDQGDTEQLEGLSPETADAVIDFTHPEAFFGLVEKIMATGLPMVSGTTGWYEEQARAEALVAEAGGRFLFSSNFSVGVNILFLLNQRLAQLMNRYPAYDPFIEEQHHRHKADAPSGTAHSLAQQVIAGLDRKSKVAGESLRHRPPAEDELSVGYIRGGEIFGRHKVSYTSEIDSLSIEHHAHNRRGFALGAVIAAEWLLEQPTGFYTFQQMFEQ